MKRIELDAITLLDLEPPPSDVRAEVLAGLSASPRSLPCKYFYDARGSRLFDAICELDEYYLTRTEIDLMQTHAASICGQLGVGCMLVELGSGSNRKVRILLEHLEAPAAYVPVDISRDHLIASASEIARHHPGLDVVAVCADFSQPFILPEVDPAPRRVVMYYPGSTIGNLTHDQAARFLERMATLAGDDAHLLIGVDLVKDPTVLEHAYDDAQGVTAAFNRNVLAHINRALDADFNLDAFAHRARFNADASRIEMHLVSQRDQTVRVAGRAFHFSPGDAIHTESSHKYTLEHFAALAARANLRVRQVWTDPDDLFSVQLLTHA